MTYNVLGFNPGHNGSAALTIDGELVYYVEEERLSRQKYDGNPFRAIIDILSRWHVDEVIIGGTNDVMPSISWSSEEPNSALIRKFNPNVIITDMREEHHFSHAACAFYNSGFDKSICVVVDGSGSLKVEKIADNVYDKGYETESVWVFEYPCHAKIVHKTYAIPRLKNDVWTFLSHLHEIFDFNDSVTATKTYEAASDYLGFGFIEAGKTMGLASYGEEDKDIPPLYYGNRGSKDVFIPFYPAGALIDQKKNPMFRREHDPREWHRNPEKLTKLEKNLAWKIQQETQRIVGDYIQMAINKTGIKNVCISGGYGLNCVANYYFKKRFPDVNFYNEPVSHDGGTAIGLAKYGWYNKFQNKEDCIKHPLKNLYLGPKYDNNEILNVLEQNNEWFEARQTSYQEVAKLLANRNIVAMYQGGSEAGPRALGNRSILYDPTDPKGKDFVNTVKGREWFRPFAGTVLKEHTNEYFDMAGLKESPFMMYAVDVLPEKLSEIPCITHVDNTCRIQTVTEEQNKHYYNLIKAFNEIKHVPILFNTSFNLAGDPLVETIYDALDTLYKSGMKYLYLPELELLVEKK
jgi:carbamoyltransferase